MKSFADMFRMFSQFFSAMTVLGSAAEKGARSLENLAIVGENATIYMVEESKITNASKLKTLQRQLDAEFEASGITEVPKIKKA